MPQQSPSRSVRVFLSSTFLDMQEEREELIRRTFGELRDRCEARGVNWGEVDLRWGVTREQAERGLALPICLAEIDECRPFFLAILGERYGWMPGAIEPEVVRQYPWLDGLEGRSVTELEIRHGALNGGPDSALFYFRDPSGLDPLDRPRFETADPEGRRRLAELKAEILASGHPVRVFRDPRELGAMVRDDLGRLFDRLLPAAAAGRAERDSAAQAAWIDRLSAAHVGRDAELRALDRHAEGRRPPAGLVVTGEAGSGKSSLMARWVARLDRGRLVSTPSPPAAWRFFRRLRDRSPRHRHSLRGRLGGILRRGGDPPRVDGTAGPRARPSPGASGRPDRPIVRVRRGPGEGRGPGRRDPGH